MISVIASIVGAYIAGIYTPLASPVFIILKRRKNLAVIAYFFYVIVLSYEFEVSNIYRPDLALLAVILPAILLLEECLRGAISGKVAYVLGALVVAGILNHYIFYAAVLFAIVYSLYRDKPYKGAVFFAGSVAVLIASLVIVRPLINYVGGSVSTVVFIMGLSTIIALPFWRKKLSEFSGFP